MIWSEGIAGQVYYPVTELVVTLRDEAALFTVKDVTDGKPRFVPVAVLRKVWGIQPIPQEEGVTPLLGPHLRPIDCGRQHCEPGPGLCRSLHLTCLQYRGTLQCRRQRLLYPFLPPVLYGQPSPLKSGQVVGRPEYDLAPESHD